MKKILIISITLIILAGCVVFYLLKTKSIEMNFDWLNNSRKNNNEETLKVAGDYFSYITTFGKKRISKIDYRIITGWVKFEDITMSNIVDGPIEMAIYYIMVVGGDIQYGARTPVDLSRVFVLEGNKERLFTIEDLMEIKKDKMWTFEYYEPEGTVGHNKIILQKPIIQEREITVKESHQVASFGGESKDKIFLLKLATAQGIKSISDSRYSSDYYNYIIGISNIESKDNTKVNGIDQVLAANVNKFSDSQFWKKDYVVKGRYLCSKFNISCFFYIDNNNYDSNFVYNSKENTIEVGVARLDWYEYREKDNLNNNLVFSMNKTETTTNYYVSKNSESNGSWIEGIDHIRVNVDDFIKTDSELSSRLGKLQERKTQIIFDMDYHVVALGKLVCDDAEYIIQSGYWNCVFYPMSFSLLNNNDNNN